MTPTPYMPVLKWKKGEQEALRALSPSVREVILPLIELRAYKEARSADQCIAPLPLTWAGLALFDCADPKGLLTSWRLSTFDGILGKKGTTNLVPVVNVDDPVFNDIKRSNRLKSAPHGIALRFRIGHAIGLSAAGLDKKVSDAKTLGWPVHYVVIDLMTTPEVDDPDVKTLGAAASELAGKGYVVHIVSGSYPNGYKNLNVGLNEVDRRDWHLFKRLQKTISDPQVGYGDYTVVAPDWVDKPGGGSVPTAYRYADTDRWVIYKGTSSAGQESFALSMLLSAHSAFRGPPCCKTDQTILDRANAGGPTGTVKPGNSTNHIAEGIAHHITLVVQEQYP